jgi:hypothetical protein
MAKIIIRVKKGGGAEIRSEGVKGDACTEATRPYREQMAGDVISDKHTEEMHETPLNDMDLETDL